ncbi:hypothetical protein C8R43DRAFT_1046736 [Mycena crocata]|nr:hypothetical protein C8R43DRAFT_1046736 [Mycena crocata]
MSRAVLPRELCDLVVDYLHAERATLSACALVCRAWVPASRFHLFAHIVLSDTAGHAAARLNALLGSPHATLAGAVRSLDLFNALAPIQIRGPPADAPLRVKTLLEIVPRIVQLRHVHTLALSDLPFDVLPAFARVRTLRLQDATAGPGLLRLATCFPSLTHLTLERVHAIPYRTISPSVVPMPRLMKLRRLTVRGSSLAFLGWMGVLAPRTCTLELDDMFPSELPYLTAYLSSLDNPLESLDLGLSSGADVRAFVWDALAGVLGAGTRLVICIDANVKGDADDDEGDNEEFERAEVILRAVFSELQQRKTLEVKRRLFD